MFRLAFAATLILLLWAASFCTDTAHTVVGTHHIFAYNWVAWAFFAAFMVLLLGFSRIAWRKLNDRAVAGIMLVATPLMCLVLLPQLWCERVEITDDLLIHRREPPHTDYNVDIALDDIAAVTQIKRETGSFSTYYAVGYTIVTRGGRQHELPSGPVVTAAHETINSVLAARDVPIEIQVVRRPPPE